KNQKKENAQDIISKSIQKVCTKNLGRIDKTYASKFGFIIGYSVGSKSKPEIMKSYQILKNESEQKLKNNKKENALGVISKSLLNAVRKVRAGLLIHSKYFQL
ncbi:hypothetical protein, partial [Maribacter sp. 2308TA10-17]|uniref:hypothetical protein n=1 Tax=Maribacter sp. 2308TA10-17 TaxID=3386276 RepID=UPI0039BC4C5E